MRGGGWWQCQWLMGSRARQSGWRRPDEMRIKFNFRFQGQWSSRCHGCSPLLYTTSSILWRIVTLPGRGSSAVYPMLSWQQQHQWWSDKDVHLALNWSQLVEETLETIFLCISPLNSFQFPSWLHFSRKVKCTGPRPQHAAFSGHCSSAVPGWQGRTLSS